MKDTLIFIPGTLCTDELWCQQERQLQEKYPIVHADIKRDTSLIAMAHRILEETSGSLSVAGLSMGGMVALELVRLAPERVARLALLGTNPYPPTPVQRDHFSKLEKRVKNGEFLSIPKKELIPKMLYRYEKDLVNVTLRMAEETGEIPYLHQLEALQTRHDQLPILKTIQCPTLIMTGENDLVCPPSLHEEMHRIIPQSSYVKVRNCGHLIPIEQPQVVLDALEVWLKEETRL